jgi:DNA-binding transcriptional MerR regulator
MRAAELINSIPGITMDHLHNWERQGYLAPGRIRVGKKQIRNYTEKEAYLVKMMWFYYQKGLSPRNAYKTATEEAAKKDGAALSLRVKLCEKERDWTLHKAGSFA